MENGYYSDTHIRIADSGWVHVEEAGKWFPPTQVRYIDPSDETPESH